MTTLERAQPISVTRRIAAPPSAVFEVLATPSRHQDMDGSAMLRGTDFRGRVTERGDVFVMKMHYGPIGDYEMANEVVAFEPDRAIAWEPVAGEGHPAHGTDAARWGHRWGFALQPDGPGATLVTETWDCSRAADDEDGSHWIPGMTETLARLAALTEAGSAA